jgi:AAHS family 4-hydroxybenzoate transporter-like MFS transporter
LGSLAGGALLGLGLGYSAILMLLAIPAMLAAGAIALQGGRRAQGIVHPR